MKTPEDYERLLPDFKNPNATIYIRSLPDKKIVWVNHEFVRDHGFTYDFVIGKTIVDLFGTVVTKPWEMSDALTIASNSPTTTVEPYDDPEHGFRQYGLTKFIASDGEGNKYIVGIGVEIKAKNKSSYDKRLRELTDQVLAQLREVTLPSN